MTISTLYRSHAPVFKVEDERVGDLARDLEYLEVEETAEGLKTLRARLLNVGRRSSATNGSDRPLYFDGDTLDFGKKVEVSLGPASEARVVFTGRISALEARFSPTEAGHLVIFAEDALMQLRMTRRFKTYEHVTDADLARSIANEHALGCEAEAEGPAYDVVQQWNQSDLAFLRERADLLQAEIWVDGETLCFKTRDARQATEVHLEQGKELLSVQIRADLSHQRTAVRTSGYDARERNGIEEEADSGAILAEIVEGRTGCSILQRAFGERASMLVRRVPLEAGEARAWSRAELLRRARSFVNASGLTRGTPDLVVGSRVTLDGVGGPFNGGGYYVTHVRHTFDQQNGHRTAFNAERATLSESA